MKDLRNYSLLLMVFGMFLLTSCGTDDDATPDPTPVVPVNIVETAQATDDLSILVDALTQTGLVSALEANGPLTVFAPTNQAFQDLLDSEPSWNSLADIDNDVLSSVLLFHVLGGEVRSTDLADSYITTNTLGPNDEPVVLQIETTNGVVFNGNANPVTTDVDATNGVVHIIDAVMLPPSVVNLALNNDAFSTLVAALTRPDLSTDYVSVLSGAGPFTVFAPTNEAFQALLDSNVDWTSLDDIPTATLEAVLNYHVVSGANVQAGQLVDDQVITTIGGVELTTDLVNGSKLTTTSAQSVNIVLTDVQGTNGVVHAIDAVLLP